MTNRGQRQLDRMNFHTCVSLIEIGTLSELHLDGRAKAP